MQFTNYQRWLWTCLSYLTVCRFVLVKDNEQAGYRIQKSGKFRTFFYYAIWVNSIIKITFLILTYHGWLGVQVGFLDQMSMWDWFLCFSQLVQETNLWYRKYPLFEVIHANWTVQEDIYKKLGSPKHIDLSIIKTCKSLVRMHGTIVFVGCGALVIQFFTSPKYALNTYSAFSFDSWWLRIIFAAHEYTYMFHIWIHQAFSIVLLEMFSVTYAALLSEMRNVLDQLSKHGAIQDFEELNIDDNQEPRELSKSALERMRRHRRFIPDRVLNPKDVLSGTHYCLSSLLHDYKKIMIAAQQFNAWAGKIMGGTTMSNYGQFISDVFMMIQLLKEPDVDFLGVFFFFEDACAGMTMLFRMLILVSKVYPASNEFLKTYKTYLQHQTPDRRYLIRYQKTLRIVATKIGGYSTNPTTVPHGINALMNYYIGAAMWKRPDASSGRRT